MIRLLLLAVILAASPALSAPTASRTSGVAPLYVHFDADAAASTTEAQPFHTYEYSWDFGDTGAGTWGTSGASKNADKGPVAGHVYDGAGTYTATLTVRNAGGVVGTPTEFEITVSDPDTIFDTTKTTCVSTGSDWTGCPSGAAHVTTSSLAGLSGYTDAGERVLLHRGDSWTVGTSISFPENTGPVHIGAFGTCTTPDALGICSNAPEITITGSAQFIDLSDRRDWRVADLEITGAKTVPYAIFGIIDVKDTLVYRMRITGFSAPFESTHWRENDTDYFDNNALVSSHISGAGTNVAYMGGERVFCGGNILQDADVSHVLRFWQAYKTVISHNIISGSSLTTADGRHALKLHGSTPYGLPNGSVYVGTYAQTGGEGLRNHTQFVVVADNVFGSSGPWPVSAGPQDDIRDERLSDVIFEKNRFLANYGNLSVQLVQVGLMFEGRYFTVRNNILDGTGASDDYTGIYVARRGVEWTPLGNRVYNNTIYSQTDHGNQAYGVEVHSDADSTIVRNNLISFPNTSTQDDVANNAGGETTISNNLLTNTPYLVDPSNATPLSRDFSLTAASTASINQGHTVPVFDDFAGDSRIGVTYDIGADEYETGGDPQVEVSFATGVISGGVIQ